MKQFEVLINMCIKEKYGYSIFYPHGSFGKGLVIPKNKITFLKKFLSMIFCLNFAISFIIFIEKDYFLNLGISNIELLISSILFYLVSYYSFVFIFTKNWKKAKKSYRYMIKYEQD